jgi:hypothetical protein
MFSRIPAGRIVFHCESESHKTAHAIFHTCASTQGAPSEPPPPPAAPVATLRQDAHRTRIAGAATYFAIVFAAGFVLGAVPLNDYLAHFATAPVLIGLAGQVVFALMPLVRRKP